VFAYRWPYLIYDPTFYGTGPGVLHVRDLVTGTDVALTKVSNPFASGSNAVSMALTGDTLSYSVTATDVATGNAAPTTSLYEVDSLLTPDTSPRLLATYASNAGGVVGANARLVVLTAGAWDFVEGRLVTFPSGASAGRLQRIALAGDYLAVMQSSGQQPNAPQQVTIYDTARLPVLAG
jgi:hypothetical protein